MRPDYTPEEIQRMFQEADYWEEEYDKQRDENARLTAELADAQSNISAGEWEALTGFREENERLRGELATERARVGRLRGRLIAHWEEGTPLRVIEISEWLKDGDLANDPPEGGGQ